MMNEIIITPIANGLHKMTFPVEKLGHSNIYFTEYRAIEEHFCIQITLYRESLRVAEFFNSADILKGTVDALRGRIELVEVN